MATLPIVCSFCDWHGTFRNYSEHLSTHSRKRTCEHRDREFVAMDLCIQHQSECPKTIVSCQLQPFGCTERFLCINTRHHLLTEKHQSVMLNILSQATLHPTHIDSDEQSKSTWMDDDLPRTIVSTSTSKNDRLDKTIDVLMGGVQVLNDDTQKLSSKSVRAQRSLQFLAKDLTEIKTSVQETDALTEGVKSNQETVRQDFDSLKQDVEDRQSASYDGTFLWRITDVQKKIADAQCGKQSSIYSPPFYSSPTGYKMCARLYFYGDGNGRRTHISLYFVLIRGEYDAILQFPFTYKVTFCLYDQTDQQRHIIDSFQPDIKSSSFQRPRFKMNIASGLPNFFPLAPLRQDNSPYIRSDTMYIKVMVHFDDTPNALLPYILSINPGLPALIQQVVIKHETEKRAQQQQPVTVPSISTTSSMTDDSK